MSCLSYALELQPVTEQDHVDQSVHSVLLGFIVNVFLVVNVFLFLVFDNGCAFRIRGLFGPFLQKLAAPSHDFLGKKR